MVPYRPKDLLARGAALIGPILPPAREEALSQSLYCPWSDADALVRREARALDQFRTLFALTGSIDVAALLTVLLSCYDALYRSALIAEGHLQNVRSQIERMQTRAECPVILSVAHARGLILAEEALAEALAVREMLGDWREELRERAG
jgi:hypothetical protein